MDAPLVIAGKEFQSRLMVGTGRHRSMDDPSGFFLHRDAVLLARALNLS